MIWTQGLLPTHQCSLVHLLCLPQLALASVEIPNVVNCKKSGSIIWTQGLFRNLSALAGTSPVPLSTSPGLCRDSQGCGLCWEWMYDLRPRALDELPRRSIAPDPNGTVEDPSGDLHPRYDIAAIIEPLRPTAKWTGIATGNHASSPRTRGSGIADPNPVDPK